MCGAALPPCGRQVLHSAHRLTHFGVISAGDRGSGLFGVLRSIRCRVSASQSRSQFLGFPLDCDRKPHDVGLLGGERAVA